jgi:hypothetical protein
MYASQVTSSLLNAYLMSIFSSAEQLQIVCICISLLSTLLMMTLLPDSEKIRNLEIKDTPQKL